MLNFRLLDKVEENKCSQRLRSLTAQVFAAETRTSVTHAVRDDVERKTCIIACEMRIEAGQMSAVPGKARHTVTTT